MTFKNKNLLITGGTGSFGNEVLSQFLESDIAEIRIFSRDEKKQEDMRISFNNNKLKFYLGDVRNYQSIKSALKGVDYVFHAAALKQVPSCEFYPMEAIETNILGAENVINAAIEENVKSAVFLSTDKAVYPINAMGLSKAMMEKLVSAKARDVNVNNTLCTTRYGNVMASRGSVIPLFVSQIQSGKPLTITDLNMTRFFISLDDGIKFVLESFLRMKGGEIFIPKLPSCYIKDLAKALDSKVKFKVIGIRPGEKLHESLCSAEESHLIIEFNNHYVVEPTIWEKNIHVQTFMINKKKEKGKKVKKGFEYNSLNNPDMINIKSIQKILKKVD